MIRLVCAVLSAVLLGLVTSTSAGAMSQVEISTVIAYNHDDTQHPAPPTDTTSERGPPARVDTGSTYDAVDRWSLGGSVRPSGPPTPGTYGYDDVTGFGHSARGVHGAEEQVNGQEAGYVVAQRSDVAAKTGPGAWGTAAESMSSRAAAYQARVTGGAAGSVYRVGGVKVDGFANGVLQEAKGPGYASFVCNGQFQPWFSGADGLVSQAQRQLAAAGGTPITWSVAEGPAATAINNLFVSRGISGINVMHVP